MPAKKKAAAKKVTKKATKKKPVAKKKSATKKKATKKADKKKTVAEKISKIVETTITTAEGEVLVKTQVKGPTGAKTNKSGATVIEAKQDVYEKSNGQNVVIRGGKAVVQNDSDEINLD